MPVSAASSVLMPFDMASRSEERSLPRRLRLAAVKKLVGLSRVELTFLPVARRSCTLVCISAVLWRVRRLDRMLWDNTIPFDMERIPSCTADSRAAIAGDHALLMLM